MTVRDIKKRTEPESPCEPRPFFVQARFGDIDELGQISRAWDLDFRQIDRGPFEGELVQWGSGRVQLARGRLRGRIHQRGSTPAGYRTFAIPAIRDMRLFWRGHDVDRDQILVFPRHGELDCASHPDFDMLTISVTEESLDEAAHRMRVLPLDRCLAGREVVSCDGDRLSRARRWLCRALQKAHEIESAVTPERTARLLMQLVASSSFATAPRARAMPQSSDSPRVRLGDSALRLALDFIARAEPLPHSVRELARVAGCSERTLRRAFHARFGVGPKTYLLAQRLTGARRELRNCDPGTTRIVDVANRWGFWHMGQFAADYRLFFGELPSTTLGR